MKKGLHALIVLLLSSSSVLAGTGMDAHMQHIAVDVTDKAALQRGAKLFMNYCSGCHSLKFLRYSQMARGLGLMTQEGAPQTEILHNNLIFSQAEVFEPVEIAMPKEDARQWFGIVPPDLSLVARVRGTDWLYTYLKGFYEDKSKLFGVNNLIFPDVAMPNVLYALQGQQVAVYGEVEDPVYGKKEELRYLQVIHQGSMSSAEFDRTVQDLVTFLSFVGEPQQLDRIHLGYWVIGFLLILLIFSYLLKKEYWRLIKK